LALIYTVRRLKMKTYKQYIRESASDTFGSLKYSQTSKKELEYSFSDSTDKMSPMSYAVAKEPMEIETILPDGKETKNKAEPGDIIISGVSGEKYVVKAKKFGSLYSGKIGEKVKVAPNPREVAKFTGKDEITFKAPWGEDMVAKPGDYIVKDVQSDGSVGYYRIAKSEFEKTYNPIADTSAEKQVASKPTPNTQPNQKSSTNSDGARGKKPGEMWKTKSGMIGVKNMSGEIRYFDDERKATDFARGR
jgi:hypothetical protein